MPGGIRSGTGPRAGRIEPLGVAAGRLMPGARHCHRVQGGDLLIEYGTTDDGNHAHTVPRRPRGDPGEDILEAHYRQAHS